MQLDIGSRSGLQSEINITPLVDVVLVLLIIFMVVVPLMMEGYDVDIAPTSTAANPAQSSDDSQVVLSIALSACPIVAPPAGESVPSDCRVTLGNKWIPASELPQSVANMLGRRPADKRVLFLSADDRMNYEGVLRILDLAKSKVQGLKIEFLTAR